MKYIAYRMRVIQLILFIRSVLTITVIFLLSSLFEMEARAQVFEPGRNYTIESVPREPFKNIADLYGQGVEKVNRTICYYDGLGRPVQVVQHQASPSKKDIVQHKEYDAYGRESIRYLPYAEQTADNGKFKLTAKAQQLAFYGASRWDTAVVQNTKPLAVTVFENSPLNRVLEQGSPGVAWQPAATRTTSGRTVISDYGSNVLNEVKLWKLTADGASTTTAYTAGRLYKKILKDENWTVDSVKGRTEEEFTDFDERVVLRRVWETKTKPLDTYYIYDDLGNLRYVLPPGFTGLSFQDNMGDFNELVYAYRYDSRRRLSEKKVPGKGWEWLVYNLNDQQVLSQDANQRGRGEWSYTKYDAFGRIAVTGKYTKAYVSQKLAQDDVSLVTKYYEERLGTAEYTNVAFPTNATLAKAYVTNFYDDYLFSGGSTVSLKATLPYSAKTQGLLTGSRIVRDDGTGAMLTVNYYNELGQLQQSASQSHIGGVDLMTYGYNFVGESTGNQREHRAAVGGTATTIMTMNMSDHVGRVLQVGKQVNSQPMLLQSASAYNEIGQLKSKGLHSEDGQNFLSTVRYSYNERGWTKRISSGEFTQTLLYQDGGTVPQYNGNIAQQRWRNGAAVTSIMNYGYDGLNRLRSGTGSGGTTMSEAIRYDVMGNIVGLKRDGGVEIAYQYLNNNKSNRLDKVSGGLTGSYGYDANGNATLDRTGLTFSYTDLNLPKTATKVGTSVNYLYDATGLKIRKMATVGAVSTERNYVDGIEYSMNGTGLGTVDRIATEEGFLLNNGGTYSYYYYQPDHLGNVRAVIKKDVSATIPVIVQRQDYYPFGKTKSVLTGINNRYFYNGKEVQEELGNQLDYGARFYDAEIGRFNVIDRFSEKYSALSPYQYGGLNPLKYIDVNGDSLRVRGSDEFLRQFMKDLRVIIKDEKVAKIFSYLHSSKTDIYITEAKSITGAVLKAAGNKETGEYFQMKESGVSHTGRGLEIEYSQLNGVKMQDVEKTNSAGTLAHELTHVRDVLNGQEGKDYKIGTQKGLKGLDREHFVRRQMEKRAVESENRIRVLFGLPDRKTYKGEKIN